eukprot:TRINITY_DN20002_c0_g1_i2.p1 TRINITY_DN20002_c0_g1~~TRINITY_DN20002_c0_g1_i2.p1  ORF type:complete len:245 (-),score=57.70 TRINITY_DN20002_c0_g1_i2:305-1039(-)
MSVEGCAVDVEGDGDRDRDRDRDGETSTPLDSMSEEFELGPSSPRNGESELVAGASMEDLKLAQKVFVLESELKEAKEVIAELERRLRDQSVLLVDPEEEQETAQSPSDKQDQTPQTQEGILGTMANKTLNYFIKWKGEKFYVPEKYPTIRILLWSFIGAFFGIAVVSVLHSYWLSNIDKVGLIGSMGAAAILLYGTQSPLAQPRNVLGGNVISALVGVSLHYAFASVPEYNWIAGKEDILNDN